ncbi:MAG: hypothetical protein L3J09_01195 [Flavobacteriaceae bacterium]|nr:hypothetical protein [Flavobacteriaceae bacterium]
MKKITIIGLVLMISTINLFAQTNDVKYRRSSLYMVLIESETFPNKDLVMKSWDNYPFPDKYNNHFVDAKSMNPANYKVTDADRNSNSKPNSKPKSKMGGLISKGAKNATSSASEATGGAIDNETKEMPIKIEKFINETDLARKIVAKWFSVSDEGKMDMKLVHERGFYNATEMDAAIASGQTKGLASLRDAGKELISKTFITFSKLSFVPNEPIARAIRDAIYTQASGITKDAVIKVADLAYEKGKEGYSVWTNTWLYQLEWDESIASAFWEIWNDKEAFDKSDIFKLKYVGKESSQSLVTFSLKKGEGQRSDEQVINLATVRNIDKVFAKLQKEYDVFKPMTEVLSTEPITAKIGLKEGLKAGDKFEVLEMVWDEKLGITKWEKVGTCSVDKKIPIWDNRYNAGQKADDQNSKNGDVINVTTFKGSKKIQPGMLLKQLK